MDLVFRGGESPGYYPSTPPQHHKGRPRKRKVPPESEPCGELPVTMRMAAATLGKNHKLNDEGSCVDSLKWNSK